MPKLFDLVEKYPSSADPRFLEELKSFIQSLLTEQKNRLLKEALPEEKENLPIDQERDMLENIDALIEQSEIVGFNTCLSEIKQKFKEIKN